MKGSALFGLTLISFALAALGCGGDETGTGGSGTGTGGAGGGSSGNDCSGANTASFVGMGVGVEVSGTDVKRLPLDPAFPAFGITWEKNGYSHFVVRHGDPGAGSFDKAGSYDAASFPYHMLLVVRPSGWDDTKCMGDPAQCQEYYGLSGTWDVTSTAPFAGTLKIGTLTSQANCWKDGPPVDTSGCMLLDGEITGCWNVQ